MKILPQIVSFLVLLPLASLAADDRSAAELFPAVSKDKTGYINKEGKQVIPCLFEDGKPFCEGLAAVLADGRWGYVDPEGKLIIAPRYQEAGNFSEGMASVRVGRKYGYIARDGTLAVAAQYQRVGQFSGGLAAVELAWDKSAFIDPAGKTVPFPDVLVPDLSGFSEGLVFAYLGLNRKPAYLDRSGQVAIAFVPDQGDFVVEGKAFSEGLAAVRCKGLWGYIDKTGTTVISSEYSQAKPFREGFACVETEELRNGVGYRTTFVIDRTGKKVCQVPWTLLDSFSEGLVVTLGWDEQTKARQYGYMNPQGQLVIPLQFEEAMPFRKGLARVKTRQHETYIDRTGRHVWDGVPRGNECFTTYSGKSMLDLYVQLLREEGSLELLQQYIGKMSRDELVVGPQVALQWLLQDPQRAESRDVGREGVMGYVAVMPFFGVYCQSFTNEQKPMDPSPFRKMLCDKSIDLDFRRALAECYAHQSFYSTNWQQLAADVDSLCGLVADEREDETLRRKANEAVFELVCRLYWSYCRETLQEDIGKRTAKMKKPDIVGMLHADPCPFTPEQKAHWEQLIAAAEKLTANTLRLSEGPRAAETKRSVLYFLEQLSALNLIRDETLRQRISTLKAASAKRVPK